MPQLTFMADYFYAPADLHGGLLPRMDACTLAHTRQLIHFRQARDHFRKKNKLGGSCRDRLHMLLHT
jgi:hypothetical protein